MYFFVFFFFKQKTAYEMRISDWSSDVCSSDLWPCGRIHRAGYIFPPTRDAPLDKEEMVHRLIDAGGRPQTSPDTAFFHFITIIDRTGRNRSEEHTSELQSLMRISYAVFCLKKKKHTKVKRKQNKLINGRITDSI